MQRHTGGTFLGFPLEGFSFFQSMLLAFTSAFLAFFATTAVAIFALLAWNVVGHHSVNYADSYLYVGLPVGVLTLLIAVPLFASLWIRAKARR
jgi:preprotein translocase subunit SecF